LAVYLRAIMQLFEALSRNVAAWREENYKHDEFPAIAEILEWARQPDVPTFRLRAPQFRAFETYWRLRAAYDGKVINIMLVDVPEKKNDLVEGKYIVEAKKGATIAVRVTDMLGEEVLMVKDG